MEKQAVLVKSKKKGGEKMKKVLLLTALAVLLAVPAMAAIRTTRHNLGSTGDYFYRSTGTETTEICIFCHTPHNPTQNVPLWNRNNPTTQFQGYTGSPSINISNAGKGVMSNDSISRFCLSCHDGATSLIDIKNKGGNLLTTNRYVNRGGGSKTNIGGDAQGLLNDHPVNFRYDTVQTADTYFKARTNIAVLKFFKSTKDGAGTDYVECATCHDPHGVPGTRKFLRKINDSSSLCLSCHTK